jgi:peptide/nickel transport system substrate-binding protein
MSLPPVETRLAAALRTAVLLLAVAAAACGGGEPERQAAGTAPEGPRRGGQAVVGTSTDIAGINEVIVPSSLINSEVVRRLFLPLVDEQPDFKSLEPRLAESWELSEDRRSITFHLREDVTWSDGTPVTADDVEFTYRAWTSPEIAWEGAFALEAVEGLAVIDPHTVRFDFTHPYSTQLLDVAAGAVILPKHAWSALPFAEWRTNADWFRQNLVVDGPFDLESWTPQQEVVLKRNPLYYEQGLPYLDRLVLRVVPNQASQLTQLLGGQLDLVIQLNPDDVERVEAAGGVRVDSYWTRGYIAVGWNHRRPPFDDVRVRRALTYGIDRQTLVDSIWGPYARVIASPVPRDTWAYNPEAEPLPYDPDRARALLDEAGWRDGDGDGIRDKGGRPLALTLMTNSGNRQREDALVLIQEQLRRVGVDVSPQTLEFNTMIERAVTGDYDAAVSGWAIPTTFDFRYAFATEEIGDGQNFIAYSNPEVDRLLEQIRLAPTFEDAKPLLDRLQEIVQRDQPYTFLWQSQRLVGVSERLRGVDPNHLFTLYEARRWWVEAEP